MPNLPTPRLVLRSKWSTGLLVILIAVLGAHLAVAAPSEGSGAADVTFDVTATRAAVGRTRVVAFHAASTDADRVLEAKVSDPSILELVDKPAVLAGSTNGFVRVRGLKAGTTTLTVGRSRLRIDVVERHQVELEPNASIIEPANGAVVWGTFTVGVEADDTPGTGDTRPDPKVTLRLSTGQNIEPSGVTPRSLGPTRRFWFQVDTTKVPAGPLDISLAGKSELGGVLDEQKVRVRVIQPGSAEVTKIEAEETFTGERPERFKRPKVAIGNDKDASGGKFVNNAGADPAACLAFHVDKTGWYQAAIVAAADFGGGAFPTVGLVVDNGQYPATNARLCTSGWHRLALGVPVRLEAGDRVLTPYYLNDFAAGRLSDRNLRLDYIELVRVDGGAASSSGSGSMMREQANSGEGAMAGMESMAMMAGGAGMEFSSDDPTTMAAPLRVGLAKVLDGQALAGELEVEGVVWFEGIDGNTPAMPPRVTLVVNGEDVSSQWSIVPRFEVDAGLFKRGSNTIQLVARAASGVQAKTPVQTLTYEPPRAAPSHAIRRYERFTAFDPRWDNDIRARIQKEQGVRDRTAAAFSTNGVATLNLPEDLTGPFALWLEARSQDFKGPAVATIKIRQGGAEPVLVKEFSVQGRWDTKKVATIDLKSGPKQLTVAFENDAYEEGKGDRNLYLQSVSLYGEPQGADTAPPSVAIEYPKTGVSCFMADAVVATAADDVALASVELLIDGVATGDRVDVQRSTGRVLLPLLLRGVKPGRHAIAVKATDAAKNETTSTATSITVLASAPSTLGTYDRAIRLLDRFAFGPDADALTEILVKGEQRWLNDSLAAQFDAPGDLTAFTNAVARIPNARGGGEVQRRALLHALTTPNPARTRFVLWAENHFSTWVRKTEGPRKWSEHVAFSRLGVAPFGELLEASSRSPAMLRYLDQENSYTTRLNENYAREIMELHCLGVHGGYTQQDVTNLAHLLTGWTVSREGDGRSGGEMSMYNFRFDPALNDRSEIKVIGVDFGPVEKDGAYDRIQHALEVLTAHPSTAHFIARKLADHYLGCPAPDAVVDDLAKVFESTDGDMNEVLLTLARHPAFWAPEPGSPKGAFPAQRLAHPQDFAIRLSRVSHHINAYHAADFLARTGQGLFDRPTPDGYSEHDSDYTDSNAMIQRWKVAQDISADLVQLVPDAWKREPAPTPPPTTKAPKDSPKPPADPGNPADEAAWSQQVVDMLAVRLTGRVLSPTSNAAALQMLGTLEGKRLDRVQKFAPLMAQLPEAHLR